MKAKDLRKGNWYYNRYGLPKQVTTDFINQLDEIQSAGKICLDITPIPLTEQWLMDFGFEKDGLYYKRCNVSVDFSSLGVVRFKSGYRITYLDFVNQLQNLYYALRGKELIRKQQ